MIHIPFAGTAARRLSRAALEGLGMDAEDAAVVSRGVGWVVAGATTDWTSVGELMADVGETMAEGDWHP